MPRPVEEKKRPVVAGLQALLRAAGFRKHGSTFVRELPGIRHVIALQSSSKTTSDEVVLTVNLSVIAPDALHSWEPPTSASSGHWRARLGQLSPAPTDRWWSITDSESAAAAAGEIVALTRECALPVLDSLATLNALLETLDRQVARGLTPTEQAHAAARIRQRCFSS